MNCISLIELCIAIVGVVATAHETPCLA